MSATSCKASNAHCQGSTTFVDRKGVLRCEVCGGRAPDAVATPAAPRSLSRVELDAMACPCGSPACDGLVLSGRCHPSAPTVATYQGGVVVLACAVCRALVTRIAVAAEVV